MFENKGMTCTYVCDCVYTATIIIFTLLFFFKDKGQEFLRMRGIQTLCAVQCLRVNNASVFIREFRVSCILQMSEQKRVILFIWFTLPFSEQSRTMLNGKAGLQIPVSEIQGLCSFTHLLFSQTTKSESFLW